MKSERGGGMREEVGGEVTVTAKGSSWKRKTTANKRDYA
jgi:hypothetical protein